MVKKDSDGFRGWSTVECTGEIVAPELHAKGADGGI